MFQQQSLHFGSLENPLLQPALAPREGGHLGLQACPRVEEQIDDEGEEEEDDDEDNEEEGEEEEEEDDDDDDDDYEEPPTRPGRRKMPFQYIKTAPMTEEEEDEHWARWDAFEEKMKPILARIDAKREATAQRKAAQRKAAQREAAQRETVVVC
ncbi:hypothetical protein E4U59_002569 [Claviceps monticola]|nr:hypothetical protein E4U59_002569 [Claviceps monticola]